MLVQANGGLKSNPKIGRQNNEKVDRNHRFETDPRIFFITPSEISRKKWTNHCAPVIPILFFPLFIYIYYIYATNYQYHSMLPDLIGSVNVSYLEEVVSQNRESNMSTTIGTISLYIKVDIIFISNFLLLLNCA